MQDMITKSVVFALACVVGGFLIIRSPFRLIRRWLFQLPLSEEPDSILRLMLLWFLDIVSWLITIILAALLFNLIWTASA